MRHLIRTSSRLTRPANQTNEDNKLTTLSSNFFKFLLYLSLVGGCTASSARTYVEHLAADSIDNATHAQSLSNGTDASTATDIQLDVGYAYQPHNKSQPTSLSKSCGAKVVLSELMIDPAATKDALGEYLELYNPASHTVDLRGWTLSDGTRGQTTFSGDLPIEIPAGGFVVIAASGDPDENGDIDNVIAVLGKVELANAGGLIQLRDPCGKPVFRVRYGIRSPWPKKRAGVSVELRHPEADPAVPESWIPAKQRSPSGDRGTPGRPAWKLASKPG